jgi:hypothetical protein
MKKKLIATGVLAGAITITGLAGSAYAQGGTATEKPSAPKKGHGPVLIACVGGHVKGKPEKGVVLSREAGKPPAGAPALTVTAKAPRGAKAIKVIKVKGRPPVVTVGSPAKGTLPKPPKGVHCKTVKPGTPGAPPAPPAR